MEGQLKIAYFSDLSENVQYISINQRGFDGNSEIL